MTRYTVLWSRPAENQLALIWTDAADRQAVTNAANAIDTELASNPLNKGLPLSEGMRTLNIPPLHVLFFVEEADRLVRVVLVRPLTPPASPPLPNGNGKLTS